MSENGEHDAGAALYQVTVTSRPGAAEERAMAKVRSRNTQKRHVYKMVDSPVGRLTLVATDEGLAGDSVGERPPASRAVEHRGRGRQTSGARRDRAPARGVFCRTAEGVHVEAGSCRNGLSTQGVERAADDPVRRDAILRTDREADREPGAVRAVGAANGRNPVSIVAPCHRVIGSTGKLTGFAGGLDVKARLLALEGSGAE